jgi:hypothetical protein
VSVVWCRCSPRSVAVETGRAVAWHLHLQWRLQLMLMLMFQTPDRPRRHTSSAIALHDCLR